MKRLRYAIPSPFSEILMFLLGCFFIFSAFYQFAPVTQDEVPSVQATYEQWDLTHARKQRNKDIRIYFTDHTWGVISDAFVTSELKETLDQLQSGDTVLLRIHPNSHILLEMMHDDQVLLDFDEATAQLGRDRTFRVFIGLSCCATGLFLYIRNRKKNSIQKAAS